MSGRIRNLLKALIINNTNFEEISLSLFEWHSLDKWKFEFLREIPEIQNEISRDMRLWKLLGKLSKFLTLLKIILLKKKNKINHNICFVFVLGEWSAPLEDGSR